MPRIEIEWEDLFKPIDGLSTDEGNLIVVNKEVIPIVFVPGIMGSRLKQVGRSTSAGRAWDLGAKSFFTWWSTASYALRKYILVGDTFSSSYLTVIGRDADNAAIDWADQSDSKNYAPQSVPENFVRGWATINWSIAFVGGGYGAFVTALDEHPWSEPVRHCFDLPVHCFGYNWTDSNRESGKRLAAYITSTIDHYTGLGYRCRKVILATHSMGGLVARSACKLHGAEGKVLGVVHGVMPGLGGAGAYWRIKAGMEDAMSGAVLGARGAAVTPLIGNMIGGLELLPTHLYVQGAGDTKWLTFPDANGGTVALPAGDPYEEIYLEQERFYRLIEKDWLDPSGNVDDPWTSCANLIRAAQSFHRDLGDGVHPNSVQFYGSDVGTPDRMAYLRDGWYPRVPGTIPLDNAWDYLLRFRVAVDAEDRPYRDDRWRGGMSYYAMDLAYDPESGDGTVPDPSGCAMPVKRTYRITKADAPDTHARSHEPVYSYEPAQRILTQAVEDFCLELIKESI